MKKLIKPSLTAIVIALFMVFVMLKITMDFKILLITGSIVFFIAGIINMNTSVHNLILTFIITSIYLALFIAFVLDQIPELWYFIPIYFVSTFLGLYFKNQRNKVIASIIMLATIITFVAIKIIPDDLEQSLTKTRFERIPEFTIKEISGNVIDSKTLKGKVVILDFFGTWCKPCIEELKELDKIQMIFKDDPNVVFYIINANYGGDTPEKFNAFINKNTYSFNYAYDHNSEIYNALKLQNLGIPVLLIIDKEQNIRIQHIGYNKAETNFSKTMIETINGLK